MEHPGEIVLSVYGCYTRGGRAGYARVVQLILNHVVRRVNLGAAAITNLTPGNTTFVSRIEEAHESGDATPITL